MFMPNDMLRDHLEGCGIQPPLHQRKGITSMFAIDQLNREAAERNRRARIERQNALLGRLFRGLCFALITFITSSMFAVFGWTGTHVTPNPAAGIPNWLWVGTFAISAIGCLIAAGYSTFGMLDELFLDKGDTRRILNFRK
jgi:hypothetical protein